MMNVFRSLKGCKSTAQGKRSAALSQGKRRIESTLKGCHSSARRTKEFDPYRVGKWMGSPVSRRCTPG
jgi:hypothetical protein